MSGGARGSVWLRHLAVAAAYALGYALLREVSWSYWVLFAGFRMAVLLFVPYRYWPALIVGELFPLAYTGLENMDRFGALWSAIMLVPPIALAMPVVRMFRSRLNLLAPHSPMRMSAVLACITVVSVVWTLANTAALAAVVMPPGSPPFTFDYKVKCSQWFLGNYVGILTMVPLVLMIRALWLRRSSNWRSTLVRVLRSRLARDVCIFLIPLLGLLVWISLDASESSRVMARILMFLPVIALALRHGWHGAAVGGTAASIVVAATMPALYDTTTMQAELFIAFAMTTMLLFGSQISALSAKASQRLSQADESLELARRIHGHNEVRLRRTARAIEAISETVRASATADARELREHNESARQKLLELVDGLQPATLGRHGLITTLRHGGLAQALEDYGIGYRCRAHGKISELSKAMQLDVHRLVCEVVGYQCSNYSVSDVNLRIRSGLRHGRRWVAIRLDSLYLDDPELRVRGGELLYRLAATGMGLEAIRDRAALYEGRVRQYDLHEGTQISIMLQEPETAAASRVAPVMDATAAWINGPR